MRADSDKKSRSFVWPLAALLITLAVRPCSASEHIVGYRIIHASPDEFASALRAPKSQARVDAAKVQSRLAKYFRIKRKEIDGKNVFIEILLDAPLLDDYFPNRQSIKIKLTERSHAGNSFSYDAFVFTTNSTIKSVLEISKHESGALLKLTFTDAPIHPWVLKAFKEAAFRLGFLFATRDEANKDEAKTTTSTHEKNP